MVNKKILKIRRDLDKLDNKFLNLIKKRTLLVNEIVRNKKFKKDIVDNFLNNFTSWNDFIFSDVR